MANAKRDDNFIPVGLAQTETGGTYPLTIDSVTGRLLIDLNVNAGASGTLNLNRALKDDNHVSTIIGLADDGSGLPMAAAVDPVTGYLLVDLIIE